MRVMTLDVEYTQPSKKVIQIGAAVYHATTGELFGETELFVNPGESLTQHIIDLTGITDADLSGAPTVREAYEVLKSFHKKHKAFRNPILWGSGVNNDSQMIYAQAFPTEEERTQNENFMGYRVIDVKSIYQSIQLYNNYSVGGSLDKICEHLGLPFEGKKHTALADAKNAFKVWHFLMKEFPRGFK